MFADVKKIRLTQLEDVRTKIREEIFAAQTHSREIKEQIWDLEQQQRTGIKGKQKFNLVEKLVTKRQDYQDYQTKLNHLEQIPH